MGRKGIEKGSAEAGNSMARFFNPGTRRMAPRNCYSRIVISSGNALHNDLGPYEPRRNGLIIQHEYGNDHCPRRHVQQQTALALRCRPYHAFNFYKLAVLDSGNKLLSRDPLRGGQRTLTDYLDLGIFNLGSKISGPTDAGDLHDLAGVELQDGGVRVHKNASRGILYEEIVLGFVGVGYHAAHMNRVSKPGLLGRQIPDLSNGLQWFDALRRRVLRLLRRRSTGEKRQGRQQLNDIMEGASPCLCGGIFGWSCHDLLGKQRYSGMEEDNCQPSRFQTGDTNRAGKLTQCNKSTTAALQDGCGPESQLCGTLRSSQENTKAVAANGSGYDPGMPTESKSTVLISCALWVLACILPSPLSGQAPATGTIAGHVRGPGGVSVPAATVQLINPQTGERKETLTDEDGNFAFTGIPLGNYRITLSLVGFRPDVREPIPVTADKPLKVNLAMVLAMPEGSVASQGNVGGSSPPRRGNSNLATLTPRTRNRGQFPAAGQNSIGDGAGGEEAVLRIAENAGAESAGTENATPGETLPESPDASTSAANSFLLGGGMGEAATPGEGRGGRRGMRGGGMGFGGGPGGSEVAPAAHSAEEEVRAEADRVEGSAGVAEGAGVAEDLEAVEVERAAGPAIALR